MELLDGGEGAAARQEPRDDGGGGMHYWRSRRVVELLRLSVSGGVPAMCAASDGTAATVTEAILFGVHPCHCVLLEFFFLVFLWVHVRILQYLIYI